MIRSANRVRIERPSRRQIREDRTFSPMECFAWEAAVKDYLRQQPYWRGGIAGMPLLRCCIDWPPGTGLENGPLAPANDQPVVVPLKLEDVNFVERAGRTQPAPVSSSRVKKRPE
ncbi:MAG: hypothetical protein AAGF32_08845 [Pseudomonadota bacterium]